MTRRLDAEVVGELLSALEDLELPSLQWGVTSGMLSRDEVLAVIEKFTAEHPGDFAGEESDEVLDGLLDTALLFKIPAQSPPRYRTRLGETLRLTGRLRQLFPPPDLVNPPPRWWEKRPTLVADYRLHVAPRKYPTRDVPAATALGELSGLPGWSQVAGDAAAAQIKGWDLARFQVDAASEIFRALAEKRTRGVIIGAGTGSGKTLAFYLPAFAAIASGLAKGRHQVHTLALYPRNELLRDQLREAVSAALDVADVLQRSGRRRIRVGALYGATPWDGRSRQVSGTGTNGQTWRKQGKDVICPYLPCPACDKDLLWREADRLANRDRLTCGSCDLVLDGDVALTRKTLQERPPDVLFTSTEMLSQQASSPLGRLLGWRSTGPAITPRLVLLDEVHTYSGVHGAQVALLLRRWRHSVRGPVTFVGLSATLRDAQSFFAQLTGVDETAVESIEPRPQDMSAEGREYALVVRGDPVSGASLLSTSIQAAMLYGRVLDPPGREYVHGSVGFLFTDDLDVTNRFYNDLRDAEGASGRYRWGSQTKRVLAGLRSPDAPFASDRYRDGQSWNLVQRIGWPLDPTASAGELQVGRTSSQDVGVDRSASLIVATASLEVGFNDPRVGLVLQHKAPRDAASFIQRRGRAGRLRSTRPWTVVALSDYGRDRLAYQAYDSLFSPELSARRLPVRNRSVLKMQGAQALLDWLAMKLAARDITGDPRQILRAPNDGQAQNAALAGALAGILEATLRRQDLQAELAKHLQRALRISDDEVQALLWEHPRSLLLTVVPTALRRARSLWQSVTEDPGSHPGDLLPEFITRALFDALNVPEVWFDLPFKTDQEESLPIERALREAVPGRVSRRYGYRHHNDRTWLPLPTDGSDGVLNLETITPRYTREGVWTPAGQEAGREAVQVIRPHVLRLAAPPREVADQSQGLPVWGTQIVAPTAGLTPVDIPDPSAWTGRVTSVGFATHAAGNPAEVRRITTAANCETIYENGKTASSTVRYAFQGRPAALGFRLTVDGMRFDLAPLNLANEAVARHLSSSSWRSLAFAAAVREDRRLDGIANTFQRGWLTLVYQIAFALAGLDETQTPEQVHASLAGGKWSAQLPEILRVLYRDDTDDDSPVTTRREAELTVLSKDERVWGCLDDKGLLLWAANMPLLTADLAQRSYRDTVAAAVLSAALRACPDAREQDLIVDVIPELADEGRTAIWLTETSLGGLGLIEQLASYYAADPRRFWGLVDSALGPNDYEYVDATLTLLLERMIAEPHGAASQAISQLRTAKSARETNAGLQALRDAWTDIDGYPRHSAVSALSARLLRHGSSKSTDELALSVVHAWKQLEEKLGFEVDARVIAYGVGSGQIQVPGGSGVNGDQVFSLLWPRGYQARAQHLSYYQQYAPEPLLDRLLVMASRDEQLMQIDVTQPDWQREYTGELARHGVVALTAPVDQSAALGRALRSVPTLPVDRDVLRVYGEVRQVTRLGVQLRAVVDVREAIQ